MRNVKSIEFVFENCEGFSIDAKYFGSFLMEEINTVVSRVAYNSISKYNSVNKVVMEIFSEANVEYDGFGDAILKFDRICMYRDITGIILHYDEDQNETFYVTYEDEIEGQLGSPNKNQKNYISSLGNLYLIIHKDLDIFDIFDKEEMEDEESNKFSKTMIID